MKKVFAFLSVFALTIAFVGFGAKSANAAGELFTEDPTLSENQIPMYIMDSIYTTFPAYYDYATGGDEQWAGAARMYPWNETRFQCKLVDENGNWVVAANGEVSEYAVFFSGAVSAEYSGAGNNILFYDVDAEGNVQLKRLSGGARNADGSIKWDGSGSPMDPSLSHMRTNISDQAITFDAIELWEAHKDQNGGNQYNRQLTFDGNGRMIRGVTLDGGYLLPDAEGAQPVTIAPEYCYSDGVVTKITDGVVCDVEEITDETTGETKQVTQYITNRFVWQYFSAEDYDPSMVNEVPYLSEGWDAEKWDYVNEEEDGYVCIAFVSSEGGNFKLTAEQLAVYTETCAANGLEAPAEGAVRKAIRQITVPAGGWTYDFGYLDKGKSGLCEKFMDMFIDGYYYGRKVDEEGKGMAYQSTHDFSASPIYAKDIANNGVSYQVLEGQNVVEVLQGEKVYPTKNVAYAGMAKYWQEPGNFLSYTQDTSVLELVVKQDGVTKVQPNTGYQSLQEVIDDFLTDIADWAKKDVSEIKFDTAANFQSNFGWGEFFATNADNANKADYPSADKPSFWNVPANKAKWSWLLDLIYDTMVKYPGGDTYTGSLSHVNDARTKNYCGSPQTIAWAFWYFLTGAEHGYFGFHFQEGRNQEWLDTRTNLQKWEQYCIDTATAAVDTNYVVDFSVYNPNTGLQTELTLTYVVVDEYTPILKVNKNNLIFAPTILGEKVEMPVIDEYTFCTAYNARYNGKSIQGDEISYKVHYYSETLDFDNPTQGDHVVTAKVYNQTKWVEKSFVVSIEDVTAPRAGALASITIGVGEHFNLLDGILYATDNVDGNLFDVDSRMWYDLVSKPVDIQKEGTYEVVLEIWDEASNTTEISYEVKVVSNEVNKELADNIAANKQAIDNVEGLIIELNEKVDSIIEAQNAKCGSKNAIMVQFLAAASLLVVFLRKKH